MFDINYRHHNKLITCKHCLVLVRWVVPGDDGTDLILVKESRKDWVFYSQGG